MVFCHSKLFGICTVPIEFVLQRKKQDCEEEHPIYLDWGKPLQTRPGSNYAKMCQGGGSL